MTGQSPVQIPAGETLKKKVKFTFLMRITFVWMFHAHLWPKWETNTWGRLTPLWSQQFSGSRTGKLDFWWGRKLKWPCRKLKRSRARKLTSLELANTWFLQANLSLGPALKKVSMALKVGYYATNGFSCSTTSIMNFLNPGLILDSSTINENN